MQLWIWIVEGVIGAGVVFFFYAWLKQRRREQRELEEASEHSEGS